MESAAAGGAWPLVTVITPAYNRADLIAETIDSVLAQDYPNLEYIVLDDGSADATLEVIRGYEGRLRWERHPNMGETRTVNRGFELARGAIIGVVNSDDPLRPGAVRRLVEALQATPTAVVAYPDWELIDDRGAVLRTVATEPFTGAVDMVRLHHCLPGPGAFFRREVVERLGGRDVRFRYVGDLEFWFRAGLLGDFVRVPEPLATFRVHGGSTSVAQQGAAMAVEHVALLEVFYARPDLPQELRDVAREARASACYVAGCCCGRWALWRRLGYYARALRLAPAVFLRRYPGRLLVMLLTLCGLPYAEVFHVLADLRRRVAGHVGEPV